MMMARGSAAVLLVALLLRAPLALADACVPDAKPADVELDAAGATRLYVDRERTLAEPIEDDIVVYLESNGIPGLQRQDMVWDSTCGGQIEPDTLLWTNQDPHPLL